MNNYQIRWPSLQAKYLKK